MLLCPGPPLRNLTRNATLAPATRVLRGLALSWGLRLAVRCPRDAVVFQLGRPQAVTIDMILVFVPLDLIAVDADGAVVGLRQRLMPFQVWRTPVCAAFVEVGAGTIARTGTGIGDRIGH